MFVSSLHPLSQVHPRYRAHMPMFPEDQAQSVRCGTWWQCRCGRRVMSSAGCHHRSSHCRETRGPTPLEARNLGQGREPGVSEHSPQGSLEKMSKRHRFLSRTQHTPRAPILVDRAGAGCPHPLHSEHLANGGGGPGERAQPPATHSVPTQQRRDKDSGAGGRLASRCDLEQVPLHP